MTQILYINYISDLIGILLEELEKLKGITPKR